MNVSVEKTVKTAGKVFQIDQDTNQDIVVIITDLFMASQSFSLGFKIKICNEIFHIAVECHFTAFLSVAFF